MEGAGNDRALAVVVSCGWHASAKCSTSLTLGEVQHILNNRTISGKYNLAKPPGRYKRGYR